MVGERRNQTQQEWLMIIWSKNVNQIMSGNCWEGMLKEFQQMNEMLYKTYPKIVLEHQPWNINRYNLVGNQMINYLQNYDA